MQTEARRSRGRPTADELVDLEARLMRVARQCFFEKGYGATSVNEIARIARVSKGTLYSRFSTKADLFRAIVDDQIQEMSVRVAVRGPKPPTLEAMLLRFAESSLEESFSDRSLKLNRLIYSEAGRFPELGEAAWARTRAGVQQVSNLIREYAEKEGLSCRDPEGAADTFTTLLRGIYGDVLLRGGDVDKDALAVRVHRAIEVFIRDKREW